LTVERFTFDRLRAALLFLAIAATASLMPAQNDMWWQLRAGHDMWAGRHLLVHDTFSHTAAGVFWPNHEWLSQVVLYAAYAVGGAPLVTLFCAAVVTTAWAIVWRLTSAPPKAKFLLVAFVVACASTSWTPRPQVFSLLLVVTTVFLLQRRWYGWLPLLFGVWANLHGAVLLGVALLAAAVVASFVEGGDRSSRRRLIGAAALSLACTMVTPLGWRFWVEIAHSLSRIEQLGIDEWAQPRLTNLALLPFWLIAAALVAGAVRRGRQLLRDGDARRSEYVTLCACAIVLMPAGMTAVRNIPPFLMVAVPAVAALWWRARDSEPDPALQPRSSHVSRDGGRAGRENPRTNAAIAAFAAAAAVISVALAYTMSLPRLNWTPLPAASLAALDRCNGNLYNRYDEGGYLIWFAPRHKVFVDSRQDPYAPAFIRAHVKAEATGNAGVLFARYAIGCAFLPAASRVGAGLIDKGWHVLYRDEVWAVLARDEPAALARR
jgi:hypothetical protein